MTGAAYDDRSFPAPPLSALLARAPSDGSGRGPALGPERVVADLAAVTGGAGEFLVPTTSRRAAVASLRSYNRLRPARVRAARAALATAFRVGAGRAVSRPRRLTAPSGSALLLEHLATVLDEPALVFAGTEKGGSGFVTPVLQLFAPSGRCVGFAKIGWDPVTDAMIRAEADTLDLVARVGLRTVGVPQVAWRGRWEELELVVTAPMPGDVHRFAASELPPVAPLRDVAALDGPLTTVAVRDSGYWAAAIDTATALARAGDADLAAELERIDARFGMVELDFGRWHGDWVEWNLARSRGRTFAWDWAYSAPAVPFGFDLLQFFHLRHRNLRGATPEAALDLAARDATSGLATLGLGREARAAVTSLHRLEVSLRATRAALARTPAPSHPAPGSSPADR